MILIPVPMLSHDQERHFAPCFHCLHLSNEMALDDQNLFFCHPDLRNAMVPSVMLSMSCDAPASASGITWPKESCYTSFQSSWPQECDGGTDDAVGIIWHQSPANGITWPKTSCCISFQSSWPKEWNCTLDDAFGIIWHQCMCQWHHMTKIAILHPILIILN